MSKLIKQIIITLPFLFLIQACNALPTENVTPVVMSESLREHWRTGTITFMKIEGGFFGIVTDKGEKLLPINLSKQFQQVGAQVKIQGELITEMMTIQQWGTPFKITKIELIKAGKGISENNLY